MQNVKEKKDNKEEWLSQKESEVEGEGIHLNLQRQRWESAQVLSPKFLSTGVTY